MITSGRLSGTRPSSSTTERGTTGGPTIFALGCRRLSGCRSRCAKFF